MARPISHLGNKSLQWIQELGAMAVFTAALCRAVIAPPVRFAAFVREVYKLGVLSLIIICVSALVVGMVLGLQGYHTLSRFGARESVGELVGLSLIRELGPVLTALLVAGRAGSATSAEIGAMVATEQLNGLRMLSIDPISFVVKPKATAMVLVMPLLTAMFVLCGIYGGYIVDVGLMKGDPGAYMSGLRAAVDFHNDIECCLLKAVIFGVLLGLISTYRGFTSAPTAEGVSAATTSSVVFSSLAILLSDYVITALWGV
jgi:phospholipid/cholesterol/gamma-HCH transport system permease protein